MVSVAWSLKQTTMPNDGHLLASVPSDLDINYPLQYQAFRTWKNKMGNKLWITEINKSKEKQTNCTPWNKLEITEDTKTEQLNTSVGMSMCVHMHTYICVWGGGDGGGGEGVI